MTNKISPDTETVNKYIAIVHKNNLPLARKLIEAAAEQGATVSQFNGACDLAKSFLHKAHEQSVIVGELISEAKT